MESNIYARSATDSFKYYAYSPSLPAAIIFAALFALVTVLHSFQMFRSKTWFMIPFVIGGLLETGGYICRSISATEAPGPYGLGPYLVQALLVLISPTLFAASIYMELGRIVVMIEGEKELFIRRTWLTKVSLTSRLYLLHVTHNNARVPSTNAVITDIRLRRPLRFRRPILRRLAPLLRYPFHRRHRELDHHRRSSPTDPILRSLHHRSNALSYPYRSLSDALISRATLVQTHDLAVHRERVDFHPVCFQTGGVHSGA